MLGGGALPPLHPPYWPADGRRRGSSASPFQSLSSYHWAGGRCLPDPPFAPAYRPVIGSIMEKGLRGGALPPDPPFAPAYRPVIGSIINVGGRCPPNPPVRRPSGRREIIKNCGDNY